MQVCPVCGWEDTAGYPAWSCLNEVPLALAQRNFQRIGACEEEFIELVRPPATGEDRAENWVSFDESCQSIVQFIEDAFRDVSLKSGTRLDQCMDDCTSDEVIRKLHAIKPRKRWQDIPRQDIETHGMGLSFLDPAGTLFHLPAFMRASLQLWQESPYLDFLDSGMLLYGLKDGPRSAGYHKNSFLLLDHSQHQAVAAYLQFVALAGDVFFSRSKDACEGLTNGWQDWLPDFIFFPSVPPLTFHTHSLP
jgi:hypothetical protein